MCKCFDCGNEIPSARLEFFPDTEYCVGCADKHTFKSVAESRGWDYLVDD